MKVSVETIVINGTAIILIDQKAVFDMVDKSTMCDAALNVKYRIGRCIRYML